MSRGQGGLEGEDLAGILIRIVKFTALTTCHLRPLFFQPLSPLLSFLPYFIHLLLVHFSLPSLPLSFLPSFSLPLSCTTTITPSLPSPFPYLPSFQLNLVHSLFRPFLPSLFLHLLSLQFLLHSYYPSLTSLLSYIPSFPPSVTINTSSDCYLIPSFPPLLNYHPHAIPPSLLSLVLSSFLSSSLFSSKMTRHYL